MAGVVSVSSALALTGQARPESGSPGIGEVREPHLQIEPPTGSGDSDAPASIVASANGSAAVVNLLAGESHTFLVRVSNPAGPPPDSGQIACFVDGRESDATVTDLGSGSFAVEWVASAHPDYPEVSMRHVDVRFTDSEGNTTLHSLARVDVAEWEGMLAGFQVGLRNQSAGITQVRPHHGGAPGEFAWLHTSQLGHAISYRGPREVEFTSNDGRRASHRIPDGARYPLAFISTPADGPLSIRKIVDVYDPVAYPHSVFWIDNQFPETRDFVSYIRASFERGGDAIANPGETVSVPMPEVGEDGRRSSPFSYHRNTRDGEVPIGSSTFALRPSASNSRMMDLVNFAYDRNGNPRYSGQLLPLPVQARIVPSAAGCPDWPGLPLPGAGKPGWQGEPGVLPICPERDHRIRIQLGPDADAVSAGAALWLRRASGETRDPQPGFTVIRRAHSGELVPMRIPYDGRLEFESGGEIHWEMTHPRGLTLFVRREASADEAHKLELRLLRKREWHAPATRLLTSLTLLPTALGIDPDNSAGFDVPQGAPDQHELREWPLHKPLDPAAPGKILRVDAGDGDIGGVPGFAAGLDHFGDDEPRDPENGADRAKSARLVPVTLTMPVSGGGHENMRIRFQYDASDPAGVVKSGDAGEARYEAAPGVLRLWKLGPEEGESGDGGNVGPLRRVASIQDGGDFIPAGTGIPAEVLGFGPEHDEVVFHVEPIRPGAAVRDQRIVVEANFNVVGNPDAYLPVGAYEFTSIDIGEKAGED